MKRFQLTIQDGKKVIYQSIFSYTPEQEKALLEKILKKELGGNMVELEFETVVIRSIGEKKWQKEHKKWDDMTLQNYVKQYPDIAICAAIQASVYDCGLHPNLDNLKYINGAKGEVSIDKINNGGSIGWKCILLP